MFYKGRIVIRDGAGPGDYDDGKIDSLGDNHWTEWHGSNNVRVVDHDMNVLSPIVNELYHLVRGYRWTFSSDISETRMSFERRLYLHQRRSKIFWFFIRYFHTAGS